MHPIRLHLTPIHVSVCVCAVSFVPIKPVLGILDGKKHEELWRSKKYAAPDKARKRKRKLKPVETCSFKATEHCIGELKAFGTERPYDCVGGWAERHCIGWQQRDILTVGMLYIVNYQDFCTDSSFSGA